MPRKRILSPHFFTHDELYNAEQQSELPLRLAFAGLWTQADRRGIFEWRPMRLKLAILPFDDVRFDVVLDSLEQGGFVRRYTVSGKVYGCIPSFLRWQTFHRNEKQSDDPAPPASLLAADTDASSAVGSAWISRAVRASVLQRDGASCAQCGTVDNVTLSHIVPVSDGGESTADNLRVMCRSCSAAQHATSPQAHCKEVQDAAMTATTPVTVTVTSTSTSTAASSRARARETASETERSAGVVSSLQPRNAAVCAEDSDNGRSTRVLVAAINRAVTSSKGEQPTPYRANSAGAASLSRQLSEANVNEQLAVQTLARIVPQYSGKTLPRSCGYWASAIVEAQQHANARGDALALTDDSASAQPAALVSSKTAIAYARDGDADWQGYCALHGIDWQAA